MSLTLDLSERLAAMNIDEATRAVPARASAVGRRTHRCRHRQRIRPDPAIPRGASGSTATSRWMKPSGRSGSTGWMISSRRHSRGCSSRIPSQWSEARQRSGLPMRWYFVFWTVIFNRLARGGDPRLTAGVPSACRRKLLAAMSKGILFDIEIFTAVYTHAAEGAAATDLNQHADSFEREVSDPRQVGGGIDDAIARDRPVDVVGRRADDRPGEDGARRRRGDRRQRRQRSPTRPSS